MNKKKIINYIIIGLSIISFIVLLLLINKIGVIPNKYLKLYYIVEIIFILLSIGFSFYKKKVFYVLSLVFSIILIFLNSFGYYYVKHLDKFIDKGFTGDIVDTTVAYNSDILRRDLTALVRTYPFINLQTVRKKYFR